MKKRVRQIIAIGGGGFILDTENLAIDRYVLAQARKRRPRVAYVPTASGETDASVARFYAAFSALECRPSHLSLFTRTPDLRRFLLAQDVIYVGGGNTKSMLAVFREWNMPEILHEAWQRGILLAGTSAGGICWFEQGITDSWAGGLRVLECLGFLPGSCCPHYDGERERAPAFSKLIRSGKAMPGIAIDEHAAVHFIDRTVHRVVSGRKKARAYMVRQSRGSVRKTPLRPLIRKG